MLIDVIPDQLRDPATVLTDDEFLDADRPVHCNGAHVGYIPKLNRDLPIHSKRVRVIAVVCVGCNTREEIVKEVGGLNAPGAHTGTTTA